jgi:nicotinamidase-related amidase
MARHSERFVPALLVVDMQEDFCEPVSGRVIKISSLRLVLTVINQNGSLAVPGGRELAPLINKLLDLPFAVKLASKDWHPPDHASFDISQKPPNDKAFTSKAVMANPLSPSQTMESTVWPVHCVQNTPGAEIIPEIDASKIEFIVEKGRDRRVEQFSAFADMFGNKSEAASLDLAALLKEKGVTHVYSVGLTGDCCVRCSALDARKEGFESIVIQDACKSVDEGEKGWGAAVKEFEAAGVTVVTSASEEVERVKSSR